MLKQLQNKIAYTKNWYYTYKGDLHLAQNISLKNKDLAEKLEQACQKSHGVLTYAEYATMHQFGKYGYYATHMRHGKTDVEKHWGRALAEYCKDNRYETIVEIGCGTGELGVATLKAYKKLTDQRLRWIGVEIDERIHKEIYETFSSSKLDDDILVLSNIDQLVKLPRTLVVFPYCLDNIPPQVFFNLNNEKAYPNALLGITVTNGKLSEVIISPDILRRKGLQLKNGMFRQGDSTYNLNQLKLRKGQRAYIATDAYRMIYEIAEKFDSTIIIIDEFRQEPWTYSYENLGTPKSLYEKNLACHDMNRYYRESGQHNFYYPLYKNTLYKYLSAIGFQSIDYDSEERKAAQLRNKKFIAYRRDYHTLAFISKNWKQKKLTSLPIPYTPKQII